MTKNPPTDTKITVKNAAQNSTILSLTFLFRCVFMKIGSFQRARFSCEAAVRLT
jgi:hypothetical protein